jgi:hypothetical protein
MAVVMTSSPGPRPRAFMAMNRASVPLAQETQWVAPLAAAHDDPGTYKVLLYVRGLRVFRVGADHVGTEPRVLFDDGEFGDEHVGMQAGAGGDADVMLDDGAGIDADVVSDNSILADQNPMPRLGSGCRSRRRNTR